jgi:hypothetical protein
VYYTLANPTLGVWTTGNTDPNGYGYGPANDLYNMTATFMGCVFPKDTRTVLFFGTNGIGPQCYGSGCYPGAGQGPHADPYRYQVWAYDALELAQVAAGTKNPWEVIPYAYWGLTLPHSTYTVSVQQPDGSIVTETRTFFPGINGSAYDPTTNRIYVLQSRGEEPIIQVFQV